jgi:hypothetical protein
VALERVDLSKPLPLLASIALAPNPEQLRIDSNESAPALNATSWALAVIASVAVLVCFGDRSGTTPRRSGAWTPLSLRLFLCLLTRRLLAPASYSRLVLSSGRPHQQPLRGQYS